MEYHQDIPILGHKTYFNKFKRLEITQSLLSDDYSGVKLEISNKRQLENPLNIWRLNSTLLNNTKKNSQEKRYFELNEKENTTC